MMSELRADLVLAWRWLVDSEGSTRSLALIRMGLVANCWARWGNDHVLYRDLTPEVMLVGLLFFVSSTLTFVGCWTRAASAGLAIATFYFVYVKGHMYGFEPYTHHHTTLLANACFLLALAPCGRSLSVDRWRAQNRARKSSKTSGALSTLEPERANLWALRLMALLMASIYFWGATDKLNMGFLSGARMTHYLMYFYTGPEELSWVGFRQLMAVSACVTVALEFSLAFGLFSRKYRRVLVVPGLLLHGVFYFSLSVFTFSTTMWVLYLATFDPDEVDRVLERLLSAGEKS